MKTSHTFSLTAVLWPRTSLGVSDFEAKAAKRGGLAFNLLRTFMQCLTARISNLRWNPRRSGI